MNPRTAIMTTVVAAAAVTAAAVPALAADGGQTVTEHFDAKASSAPLSLSKAQFVVTDDDVRSGKTIGRDVLSCTITSKASRCHVAFAQKGGLLYAEFVSSNSSDVLKGTVTGGTGSFVHAKGALAGRQLSQTDVKITLKYRK